MSREYTLVVEDDYEAFLMSVNAKLHEGWRCQGGVSMSTCVYQDDDGYKRYQTFYAQALAWFAPTMPPEQAV